MTRAEFQTIVDEHLGVDASRRGTENLRARAARDALMDLQRFIRAYRQGHQTTFVEADLTTKTKAHLGTLPTGAKPKAFYIISTADADEDDVTDDPNCMRHRLGRVAWEDRRPMICGKVAACSYLYAISPFSKQFLVHPLINDETELLLVWDGMKVAFEDDDEVPFPEQAAEAVAAYVKWKLLLEVDKRLDLAGAQYALYQARRLSLYREEQEAQEADGKDEEYAVAPSGGDFDPDDFDPDDFET
jgi:hypothetical protein